MGQVISLFAILVPSYRAGLDFYGGVLGFEVVANRDQGQGKRWVVVRPAGGEGTAILLAKASDEGQIDAIGRQAGGRVGFFLETDDFERDHAAWQEAGVAFEEEPRHEEYGTVAVFSDPFGNRWDLIEPARVLVH